jgi:hypothetical protein
LIVFYDVGKILDNAKEKALGRESLIASVKLLPLNRNPGRQTRVAAFALVLVRASWGRIAHPRTQRDTALDVAWQPIP